MPELPEVETIRRALEPVMVGAVAERVWQDGTRKFREAAQLQNRTVLSLQRRGKYLIGGLDDGRELIVHLGMTGQLTHQAAAADWQPPARYRVAVLLRTGQTGRAVVLGDVRGFGRVSVREPGQYAGLPTLGSLGVEPLSEQFTPAHLLAGLKRSRQPVFQVLLNQRVVSGLGTIYLTEALHQARVGPRRPADEVTGPQAKRLHAAIVSAIEAGIANSGTTLRDYRQADGSQGGNQHHLLAYGREGQPCFRCSRPLHRTVIGGRSATFCPSCQK